MILLLIILLGTLGNTYGGWSEAIKVFNDPGIATSLYVDPSTNITHFGYSVQLDQRFLDNYEIYYRSMLPNGEFTEEIHLSADPRLYRCTITGGGNGKNLYITAFGPRYSFEGHCNEEGSGYCFDIYFTESADGGKTWTSWRRVERDNMDDRIRRLGQTTVYIKETGRLFIFYSVGSYEEINAIGFVTRPKDSAVFSRESIIATRGPHYINAGVGAAYTIDNGVIVLHVVWEELWGEKWGENDNIYYTESRDLGLHWTEPRVIAGNVTGDLIVIPVAQMFSNPSINPSMLFLTYTDRSGKMHLTVSHDNGRTFDNDIILTKEGEAGHTTSVSYAGTKAKNLAFVAHCNRETRNEFTFYVYNPATGEIKELEEPFKEYTQLMSPWVESTLDKEQQTFHVQLFTSYFSHNIVGGMIETLNYPAP